MTSTNLHNPHSFDRALDRSDRISGDPGRDSRNSDGSSRAEKPSAQDRQEQKAIEAFGEEGAGIAAKE